MLRRFTNKNGKKMVELVQCIIYPNQLYAGNNKKNMKKVGRPSVLTDADKEALTNRLITASKWGFPLTSLDIRLIVKSFLDSNGLRVEFFKNNLPGLAWVRSFLSRHKDTLSVRLSENIKRCRSRIDCDIINKYLF